MSSKKVLLLVGSPRKTHSTSYSLGSYLDGRLAEKGYEQEVKCLYDYLEDAGKLPELMEAINTSEFITLAYPLYIDSFPAGIIDTLEYIAAQRKTVSGTTPRFLCIVNTGYPEVEQSDNVLQSTRLFAEKCGFKWYGSLVVGGGPLIDAKAIREVGFLSGKLVKALDLMAEAISKGEEVLDPALGRRAKLAIPNAAYVFMSQLIIRMNLRKTQKNKSFGRQPYM